MILRSPALILFVRLKDRISLYEAQDAVTEVFLTPPVDVEAVARSAAACLLETYDPSAAVGMAKPARNSVRAIDASGVSDCPANTIDGSRAITAVAEQFGSQARLAAAVSNSAECDGQGSNAPQDITNAHRGLVKLAPAELDEGYAQSPSAYGAPAEGLFFGFRPYLYPWGPGATLAGVLVGAVVAGSTER